MVRKALTAATGVGGLFDLPPVIGLLRNLFDPIA
jgi:hypothetical protein